MDSSGVSRGAYEDHTQWLKDLGALFGITNQEVDEYIANALLHAHTSLTDAQRQWQVDKLVYEAICKSD